MSHPPPPPPPPPTPEYNDEQDRVKAALCFLRRVRIRFESTPAVYEELCNLLGDYHNSPTTDASPVVRRTAELLDGHLDLIREFNSIIHPRNRIPLPDNDGDDDRARRRPPRPRPRPRRAEDEGKRKRRLEKANEYINLVKEKGGKELWERVQSLLYAVNDMRSMDAHNIYKEFARILSPDHDELLQFLADAFLPKKPPKSCIAAAAAVEKKIRAVRQLQNAGIAVNDDANLNATSSNNKKRHASNDDGDGEKNNTKTKKIKRHPLDDGEESDTCWHVTDTNPDAAAKKFRKMLDFMGWYTKLVATIKRAEELERQTNPPAHGALQDLFTNRDCHEILEEHYGERWRTVRVGDGKNGQTRLVRLMFWLRRQENMAVELMIRRRDRTRYPDADVSDRRKHRSS